MVVNIDGKLMLNGPGVTYMEIAKGSPLVNEAKAVKKTTGKSARKPAKKAAKKAAK